MLYSREEDLIADRYFDFVNDVIGVIGVSLAAASLQFEHPEPFAAVFAAVLFVWTFSKGKDYRRIAHRYLEQYKGFFGMIAMVWKLKIWLFGFMSLLFIMGGIITEAKIYSWTGF